MSDEGDFWRDVNVVRKRQREVFGRPCPECVRLLPKAHPKVLEPGHFCKMHKYRDPRPKPTTDEINAAIRDTGYSIQERSK